MKSKHMKPVSFFRTQEAHFLATPHAIEAFVSHTAHAVESDFGVTFFNEDGRDLDLIYLTLTAKVIHQVGDGKKIECGQHFGTTVTGGVVVIAVNGKDGQVCEE